MVKSENVKLKLSKCQFNQTEVTYLGFIVGHNCVRPVKSYVAAIAKLPPPTDQKSLRALLGKIGFYQRFLPNCAKILFPLYQLLKKGVTWMWDEKSQEAFEQVKKILTFEPVLNTYNPKYDCFLYTDASVKKVGGILKQSNPDEAMVF